MSHIHYGWVCTGCNLYQSAWNVPSWAQTNISNPGLSPRDSYQVSVVSPTAKLLYRADQGQGLGSILRVQQLDANNSCAEDQKVVAVNPYWMHAASNTSGYQVCHLAHDISRATVTGRVVFFGSGASLGCSYSKALWWRWCGESAWIMYSCWIIPGWIMPGRMI